MHEVAAMRGIVSLALEKMAEAGGKRVTSLEMVLGRSGHMSEGAARQNFELLAKDTAVEGAVLNISWIPAVYQCFNCARRFESHLPQDEVTCPDCGGVAIEVEHHDDCYLSSIEVADDDTLPESDP
jgi:hydrogenase nickel incorporation protein HypA/HybF